MGATVGHLFDFTGYDAYLARRFRLVERDDARRRVYLTVAATALLISVTKSGEVLTGEATPASLT